MPSRVATTAAVLGISVSGVHVATITRSMSPAGSPLAASALPAAATAMSATVSSGAASRLLAIPTRLRIHSSLVSTRPARSSLVTTFAGWYSPNARIRAPGEPSWMRMPWFPLSGWLLRADGLEPGVLGDQHPGRGEVGRVLDGEHLDAGQRAAGDARERAAGGQLKERGRAGLPHRAQAQVPPDRGADLGDDPLQPVRAAGDGGAVPVGEHGDRRVAEGDRGGGGAQRAGAMWAVWNAPATRSGRSRAPGGGLAAKAASCSAVPAATIWPAPFMFAGVSPQASIAASTAASSPPSTAVIDVARAAAACAIARPRVPTSAMASSGEQIPAIAPAASSPTLWPAAMPRPGGRQPNSTPAAATAEATSSGWATAVSLISSAEPAVPYLARSQPARSDQVPMRSAISGSSSQGARKPGVWAPCPGAAITSTIPPCTVGLRHMKRRSDEFISRFPVQTLQATFACERACRRRGPAGWRSRRGRPPG